MFPPAPAAVRNGAATVARRFALKAVVAGGAHAYRSNSKQATFGGNIMSLVDDAVNYAGLSDIVDASSQTFTDSSYDGCASALADYITAIAALEAGCGAFAGLVLGEIP